MITLFQESVPFTSKKTGKISVGAAYTNPVIMPYAFDSTGGNNIFESVIYIKNDDPSKYYKNVVITLMKENSLISNPLTGSGSISHITKKLTVNSLPNPIDIDCSVEGYTYTNDIVIATNAISGYMSHYVPVTNDGTVEVKFSWTYDEESNYNWIGKKSALLIPNIGNATTFDMGYWPIRMRIKLLAEPTAFTLRDYFIDISYELEDTVVGTNV